MFRMAVAINILIPDEKRKRHSPIVITEKGSRPTLSWLFTYLALLYNLCSSAKLDWNVCGSVDGTHGLLSNDYKVIGFGVYHIGTEGIKRFRPLAYALATGELELDSILLLHYVRCAARDLFSLQPKFKGGIISYHTEVFVNAFQEIFRMIRSYNAFLISFVSSKLMQKGKVMDSI
jgi:hypothetical protein